MKNNFTFAASWFPVLLISSFLTAFGSGVIQMVLKFIFSGQSRVQSLTEWMILTAVICVALAFTSKKLGYELNRTSMMTSTGIPVFNMLICGMAYLILFILLKGRAMGILYLFPCEMYLINGIYGPNGMTDTPIMQKTIFCLLQFIIYFSVSLAFYIKEKKKREKHASVKKPNNRFGIDVDI